MEHLIYPCIWMNGQAKAAAGFYCEVFGSGQIVADTPMVVMFTLGGQKFMLLNGGPQFKPNPTSSFYTEIADREQLKKIWAQLTAGGTVLMPLDKYNWSELYGWVQDKYGVSWQVSLSTSAGNTQQYIPTLMFCGAHQGQAAAAINFYAQLFKNTVIESIVHYLAGAMEGQVVHSRLVLNGTKFGAMDSGVEQPFTFTEGVSYVVECDTQDEIDYYWKHITNKGKESMCGWCMDEFGVWWQIIPAALGTLMQNPEKEQRVGAALMRMKKIDIGLLENA